MSDALAAAAEATLSFPSDWGVVAGAGGEGTGAGGERAGGSSGGVGGGGDVETDEAALSQRGRGRLAAGPGLSFSFRLQRYVRYLPVISGTMNSSRYAEREWNATNCAAQATLKAEGGIVSYGPGWRFLTFASTSCWVPYSR